MPVNESAVESIELEEVSDLLPDLVAKFDTAYNMFKKKAKKVNIANTTSGGGITRPAWRVPMIIQGGSPIQQGTADSTSLLRGSGSSTAAFALAPVWLFNVCEYTHAAEMATDGRERGVVRLTKDEVKRSLKQFMTGIEGLINQDGSGALDQIPTTAVISSASGTGAQTSFISGLNTAARFVDQQTVQFFPTEGGTSRGNAIISYTDPVTNTLYFSTALPAGTAVGDYLMVQGSSGAVGNSILGIPAWDVNSNTGTIGGLNRANYPGRLSCPTINKGGQQSTPSDAQRALILLGRAMGEDADGMENGVWYGPPEILYTWESQWYSRMITQNSEGGTSPGDIGRKSFGNKMMGREFQKSFTATANRFDLLLLDNWLMGMLQEVGLYDFGGGNTVMPVPDVGTTNGTYLTNKMFAYEGGFQLCNAAPRSGLYVQNVGTLAV